MERVVKLEVAMEHVQADISEIKSDIKSINDKLMLLPALATKSNLIGYTMAGLAIGLAVMGLTLGGVIGGLSWIQHH